MRRRKRRMPSLLKAVPKPLPANRQRLRAVLLLRLSDRQNNKIRKKAAGFGSAAFLQKDRKGLPFFLTSVEIFY